MKNDVDYLISLMKEYTFSEKERGNKSEIEEQEAGAETSNTNKRGSTWSELYAQVRGPGNMLGKKGEKWDSGVKRGIANQVA